MAVYSLKYLQWGKIFEIRSDFGKKPKNRGDPSLLNIVDNQSLAIPFIRLLG